MATFSIPFLGRPHIGIARRGQKGEREVVYYNDESGKVLNSQRSISLRKLIAIGVIGLPLLAAASHFILGYPK